jgi:hypothetical protein
MGDSTNADSGESLYRLLGSPVQAGGPKPPPDTHYTASIETIDNDHASVHLAAFASGGPDPTPGTTHTFTIETIDNDAASGLSALVSLGTTAPAAENDEGDPATAPVPAARSQG